MLVRRGACEGPWSSFVLKSGFGAALGRQEANWKGRRRQILARWGGGWADGMDDCCYGCKDVCVRERMSG